MLILVLNDNGFVSMPKTYYYYQNLLTNVLYQLLLRYTKRRELFAYTAYNARSSLTHTRIIVVILVSLGNSVLTQCINNSIYRQRSMKQLNVHTDKLCIQYRYYVKVQLYNYFCTELIAI